MAKTVGRAPISKPGQCCNCKRKAKAVYEIIEPGISFFRNGVQVEHFLLEACTRACARDLYFGSPMLRLPAGAKVLEVCKIK